MAYIRPFCAIRPADGLADKVAALPYDVFNRQEAKEYIKDRPLSFLNIDRAETQFPDSVDTYADCVYEKAAQLLQKQRQEGTLIQDETPCYYIYELTMDGRTQTGLTGCASIDDYLNNRIKKHENTRAEKELDRIRHVDICNAQTGPIFLAYRKNDTLQEIIDKEKSKQPLYDFVSEDGIGHRVWKVSEEEKINAIGEIFDKTDSIYIADGHHRCASAVKVGLKRREEHPDYTGEEEFNFFLSVLFADEELMIMDYNRVVKDLNGYTTEEFLQKLEASFEVSAPQDTQARPRRKGEFGMYLEGKWYVLQAKSQIQSLDPVKNLDVSLLQDYCLAPILNIQDPKTDKRIDFVGGIRGLKELEKRVHTDMKVAFAMYPTSIRELFQVADAGMLMPPKSTWFEPKLRSGLLIHGLE